MGERVIISAYYQGDCIVKFVTDNAKLSTREVILEAIKQANEATVDDLAVAADVSPVTVRHHLNSLQADGLLQTRSIRRKVGRPYYVYSLSDKGHELFPQRYVRLSTLLLDEMKAQFPEEMVHQLLGNVVKRILDEHRGRYENLTFAERVDYLVRLLGQEGFLSSSESVDGEYRLVEYSCPYYSVAQKHNELCHFDHELMVSILDTEITQHSCMLEGDSCCKFSFTSPNGSFES